MLAQCIVLRFGPRAGSNLECVENDTRNTVTHHTFRESGGVDGLTGVESSVAQFRP